jgi:hypothetical protein
VGAPFRVDELEVVNIKLEGPRRGARRLHKTERELCLGRARAAAAGWEPGARREQEQ